MRAITLSYLVERFFGRRRQFVPSYAGANLKRIAWAIAPTSENFTLSLTPPF